MPTEAGNENNTRSTSKPSQLDINLINKTYAEVTAKQNISILDNASTNVIKDNNVTLESDNYVREIAVKLNENVLDTDLQDTLSLSMPSNLMSSVFSTTSSSNKTLNHYALCGLWDFAGQKEFYATHQAFLTNNAIYLVVANMTDDVSKQDVKQVFADFQRVGGKYINVTNRKTPIWLTVHIINNKRNSKHEFSSSKRNHPKSSFSNKFLMFI